MNSNIFIAAVVGGRAFLTAVRSFAAQPSKLEGKTEAPDIQAWLDTREAIPTKLSKNGCQVYHSKEDNSTFYLQHGNVVYITLPKNGNDNRGLLHQRDVDNFNLDTPKKKDDFLDRMQTRWLAKSYRDDNKSG